ncbi:MAG: tripartite tricarboxylate transporter permease [Spirochaetales bacterium]|jgi:putative tricarboxylic transport membrane protein|nr:tripartite tricarboxylate transporter permease [Spirochaetales bacterium]
MQEITQIFLESIQVFQPMSLLYLFIGFFVGIIFGALPGLTASLAITLLLPMTYNMPINLALVMCMGIYMAGTYSGSITAITINIPGAPAAIMTCIEGNQLMKKGKGAKALGHVTVGSAIGGTIGALLLIFVSPLAIRIALLIRTPGKCTLIFFALVVIILISGTKKKAMVTLAFGLMCATIGGDPIKSVSRFTFGFGLLAEGLDTVTLIIGAFAVNEFFSQALVSNEEYKKLTAAANEVKFKRKDFFPTLKEMREEVGWWLYLKCSIIGYLIGVLPGAGASMAAFVTYVEAKRTSKHPERFGTGCVEGVAAPETANNAVCGGALVPMLSLGIPGDGVTAIILGVFLIYGITPGPALLASQMHILAPMYMALLISAAILLPLSLLLFGPYYLKIVRINRLVLYSAIAIIALLGVYAATNSAFQIGVALVIGVVMFILESQDYPNVPFILGVILGPLFEQYLRTTLTIGDGNPLVFLTNMDSLVFVILTVVFAVWLPRINKRSDKAAEDLSTKHDK